MDSYSGIRIEDSVIIVEKFYNKNAYHAEHSQGYIVSMNNPKQLETAMTWARHWEEVCDADGKPVLEYYDPDKYSSWQHPAKDDISDVPIEGWAPRRKTVLCEGITHTYKNGEFTLSLLAAAGGSTQGGRLSFWNCTITASDGKEYIIGINQDNLCDLLVNNDFKHGICQSKVWLGRSASQQSAFTESMPAFAQAKVDAKIRNNKTAKYDAGAILQSTTGNSVYVGKLYKHFELGHRLSKDRWGYDNRTGLIVNIFTKPQTAHCYISFGKKEDPREEVNKASFARDCRFSNSKSTATPTDNGVTIDTAGMWERAKTTLATDHYASSCEEAQERANELNYGVRCFYANVKEEHSYRKACGLPVPKNIPTFDFYTILTMQYSEDNAGADVGAIKKYFEDRGITVVVDGEGLIPAVSRGREVEGVKYNYASAWYEPWHS